MKYRYLTTAAAIRLEARGDGYLPVEPLLPEGETGWELVGGSANKDYLFWYWRQPLRPELGAVCMEPFARNLVCLRPRQHAGPCNAEALPEDK